MPLRMPRVPIDDPSWLSRHRDALMLSNLLRVSRLTLLHGEAGAGKSALLKNEVLPLLRRRATDVQAPATDRPRVVVPFPDRRGPGRQAGRREVAVYFDAWGDDPLSGLIAQVETALDLARGEAGAPDTPLAEVLLALGERQDARLMVILDSFEALLAFPADHAGARRFGDELAQVLNHPGVPAHFFIVVRDDAQSRLEPWRQRVTGFGDRWLRIRHWSGLLSQPGAAEVPAKPPVLVHSTAAQVGPAQVASAAAPAEEAHPGIELGIDLYLPLEPRESRPPSERVQALWDQLLSRPVAHRLPSAAAAGRPRTAPEAVVDTLPGPPPPIEPPVRQRPVADPSPRRPPWMTWSLLVIAVAALLVYAWGDSLQQKPGIDPRKPVAASGVEPAREL